MQNSKFNKWNEESKELREIEHKKSKNKSKEK